MRFLFVIVFLSSCGGGLVDMNTVDKIPVSSHTSSMDPYCGDDVCDGNETYWDCFDCVDPITGGPIGGGFCGDGICYGGETIISCWKDCRPKAIDFNPEIGPGPIDPLPIR